MKDGPRRNQGGVLIAHTLRGEGHDASEDGTGRGVPIIAFTTQQEPKAPADGVAFAHEVAPTLTGNYGKQPDSSDTNAGPNLIVAFTTKESGSDATLNLTPTLRAENGDPHMTGRMAVGDASMVRRLTPRECERLQGFPDDYTLVTYRKKAAADGPRYRALGNSMAVPCMRWIGERIAMVDATWADCFRDASADAFRASRN
jgi:DNA (cytosine-5)-methyltransferase 1